MNTWTQGRGAPGWCERCAMRWPLAKLQRQPVAGKLTDLLVCPDCLDVDHPQHMLGRLRFTDPQAIRRPAPPKEIELAGPTDPPPGEVTPPDDGEPDVFGVMLDGDFFLDESPLA